MAFVLVVVTGAGSASLALLTACSVVPGSLIGGHNAPITFIVIVPLCLVLRPFQSLCSGKAGVTVGWRSGRLACQIGNQRSIAPSANTVHGLRIDGNACPVAGRRGIRSGQLAYVLAAVTRGNTLNARPAESYLRIVLGTTCETPRCLRLPVRASSPNPSIERTAKSWPRYSTTSFLLPRCQLSSAAHVER